MKLELHRIGGGRWRGLDCGLACTASATSTLPRSSLTASIFLKISRRLGHAHPSMTLNVYGHLYKNNDDDRTSAAIEATLNKGGKSDGTSATSSAASR